MKLTQSRKPQRSDFLCELCALAFYRHALDD